MLNLGFLKNFNTKRRGENKKTNNNYFSTGNTVYDTRHEKHKEDSTYIVNQPPKQRHSNGPKFTDSNNIHDLFVYDGGFSKYGYINGKRIRHQIRCQHQSIK